MKHMINPVWLNWRENRHNPNRFGWCFQIALSGRYRKPFLLVCWGSLWFSAIDLVNRQFADRVFRLDLFVKGFCCCLLCLTLYQATVVSVNSVASIDATGRQVQRLVMHYHQWNAASRVFVDVCGSIPYSKTRILQTQKISERTASEDFQDFWLSK